MPARVGDARDLAAGGSRGARCGHVPLGPDHARRAVGAVAREAAATTLDPLWTTPHRVPRRSSPSSSPATPVPGSRRSWTASRRRTTPTCECSFLDTGTVGNLAARVADRIPGPSCARSATRRLRRGSQRGPAPRGGLGVLLPAPRRRGAGPRRHPRCSWRRPTARTPASSGRSSSTGRPPSTSSRSATPPTSSARPPRSSIRASSTRSSTTPCATCSSCPSACLLVRTDLFRALGGFDEGIRSAGDDLDLCWRAHAAGARVLVVPASRLATVRP